MPVPVKQMFTHTINDSLNLARPDDTLVKWIQMSQRPDSVTQY